MEKLGAKLEEFNNSVKEKIEALLETKGVQSKFNNSRLVLLIHDDNAMFNLDSRRYLVEIGADRLIDNEGYEYDHSVLNLEDLCIAVDSVIDGITPNFRLITYDDNGEEICRYFEDKANAYNEFVKIQCKDEGVCLDEREEEFDRHGMPVYKTINEHFVETKE
jgi:hypothetical protein